MPGPEGFSAAAQEIADRAPVDDGYLLDTFGLGPAETSAIVTFGSYTGTWADALADERCPVGGMVAKAYESEGLAGVEKQLNLIGQMSGDSPLKISETTRNFHAGNTSREEALKKPDQARPADFLDQ